MLIALTTASHRQIQILEMTDRGFADDEIARKLQTLTTEVQRLRKLALSATTYMPLQMRNGNGTVGGASGTSVGAVLRRWN